MQIRDIMTKGCECISPHATLQEAARKMRELNVGSLPVCGDNDRLAGMITDRDIAVRAVSEGLDPHSATVEQVMTRSIVYCFEDQNVEHAAKLMEDRQIRRLVVLNRDKRLVGIVSLGDIALESNEGLAGEVLERISEPMHAMI